MRTLLGAAIAVALACGATAADDKIDSAKLVGKWEPKEPKKGEIASLEFTKDGKIVFVGNEGGKAEKIEGTYKLEGNKLTLKMTFQGETIEDTVTITKLTDDELEGKGKNEQAESFRRVKGKGEKKK